MAENFSNGGDNVELELPEICRGQELASRRGP